MTKDHPRGCVIDVKPPMTVRFVQSHVRKKCPYCLGYARIIPCRNSRGRSSSVCVCVSVPCVFVNVLCSHVCPTLLIILHICSLCHFDYPPCIHLLSYVCVLQGPHLLPPVLFFCLSFCYFTKSPVCYASPAVGSGFCTPRRHPCLDTHDAVRQIDQSIHELSII